MSVKGNVCMLTRFSVLLETYLGLGRWHVSVSLVSVCCTEFARRDQQRNM